MEFPLDAGLLNLFYTEKMKEEVSTCDKVFWQEGSYIKKN